jgi:hypothetical protein
VSEQSRVLRGKISLFYQNIYSPFIHPQELNILSDPPTGVTEVLKLASRQPRSSFIRRMRMSILPKWSPAPPASIVQWHFVPESEALCFIA